MWETSTQPESRKVLSVIPIYYPKEINQLKLFVENLSKYSDVLCVFNDGVVNNYGQSMSECPGINLGTSGAYNIAIKNYLRNYNYLWLWDQDSFASGILLVDFLSKAHDMRYLDRCGIFSFYDKRNSVLKRDSLCAILKYAKSSGTLIKKSTIYKVGLFDESIPIDYADYDYIYRAFSNKIYAVQFDELELSSHSFGARYKSIFGYINAPTPARLFHQKKGAIYVAKLRHFPFSHKLKLLARIILLFPYSLIFDDRTSRIRALLGIR